MFGKKKTTPHIDKEHIELIENAQRRIKQKKRLYYHFVIFLIGALFLILANTVLGIGKDTTLFGLDWFVFAVLGWLFLLLIHVFNVFVTHNFMDKAWEQKQIEKLVTKQKQRIEELKKEVPVTAGNKSNKQLKKSVGELTIIVAAGENNAIGKDNKLIWHLKDDLKRFKKLTMGHHIIMGRKTFESFPKPLPNRIHVVITRQQNYKVPQGVILVNSLEKAIEVAKNDKQPFIIGGGQIYEQAMAFADKIEITRVHESFEADTFFPQIDASIWKEVGNEFYPKDKEHKHDFSFITYLRK